MIKYIYREKYLRIDENKEYWTAWSEELFLDREELERSLQEVIEIDKRRTVGYSRTVGYEIQEIEPVGMDIEGLVNDYGEYEDYTVAVGDTKIDRTIINNYKGQRIRVHIEVLD